MMSFTRRSWKCNIKYGVLDEHCLEHPPVFEIRIWFTILAIIMMHLEFQVSAILDFAHFLKA